MLSYKENIPTILNAVEESGAKKILDVGCAFGKYGLLIREQYLSKKAESEITPIDDMIIDAVEYTKYFYDRPALKNIYNNVYPESMFDMVDIGLFERYDLVLLIDVVEHYDKDFMKKFLSKINTKVLISTPKETVMYTEKYYGDGHCHISQWNKDDFIGKDYSNNLSHIFIV